MEKPKMATKTKETLLIVDDIPTNLKVLLTYLHDLNYEVLVAQNGEDALEKVAYAKPDLVLLDVMMPKMDGFEVCRRLKKDEQFRDIPVIFMTALTDTVDKIKGFEIGAVDYIIKPIQHEEVLARVSTHLNLRNLQKLLKEQNLSLERKNADLVRFKETIERNNQELQKQNAKIKAFSRIITHDLKGTLLSLATTINGLAITLNDKHLSKSPNNAEPARISGLIKQTSSEMIKTIDTLLLLTQSHNQESETRKYDKN